MTGFECTTPSTNNLLPISTLQNRTIGRMTYGPYVCGVTAPCNMATTEPLGVCGRDYNLTGLSRFNRCEKWNSTVQLVPNKCLDICTDGTFCEKPLHFSRNFLGPDGTVYGSYCDDSLQTDCNPSDLSPPPSACSDPQLVRDAGRRRMDWGVFVAIAPPRDSRCIFLPGCTNCITQTTPQLLQMGDVSILVPPTDVCCPPGYTGDDCSRKTRCFSSAECNGGVCAQETFQCVNCPAGRTGAECELTDDAAVTTYMSSRTVGNVTYGPYVCGVTAPCTMSATGTQIPMGTCGIDYQLDAVSKHNQCGGCTEVNCNIGWCTDLCTTGAFCNTPVAFSFKPMTRWWRLTYSWIPTSGSYTYYNGETLDCPSLATEADVNATKESFLPYATINPFSAVPPLCALLPFNCSNCVRQQADHVVNVNGSMVLVPRSDVCCPMGFRGDMCDVPVGCDPERGGTPCLNGGRCLAVTKDGDRIDPADQRCFGCDPGRNGTFGWGGRFCEIPNNATFAVVAASDLPPVRRRLLQTTGDEEVLVRTNTSRSSDYQGFVYREPSRACDCGVNWTSTAMDHDVSRPLMWMGNYDAFPQTTVLLSPLRFSPDVDALPFYRRKIVHEGDARFYCYRDWTCGGYYYDPITKYFSLWSRELRKMGPGGAQRASGPTLASLGYNTTNVRRYTLQRSIDPVRCPDATLDPVFYCETYPTQCASIVNEGGVGNLRIGSNTDLRTLATLHFHAFGHLVRNSPNAQCDLTVDWAEDETGCTNKLRAPKFVFPPDPNLTNAACGNVSRIDPARVANGETLQPGVTGQLVVDSSDAMCQCFPPFSTTNPEVRADCAYDLCGRVNGRGQINATYANALDHVSHFNHSNPDACVCLGAWATDPQSCAEGTHCDWCSATVCLNGGTVGEDLSNPFCQCLPIFAGQYCEVDLCHANHSYPFNHTRWAGVDPQKIVCDCKSGWTGTLCDKEECVHGVFDFQQNKCACLPGYTGKQGRCEEAICVETHGFWVENGTNSRCDCQAPWTGPRCAEHTCDLYNDVLSIPGWDGVRPFGKPAVTKETNSSWYCDCQWPYAPRVTVNGRAQDCAAHDCNFGHPNGNFSRISNPADACTCEDPFGIGILTDPAGCTDFNHTACPNACRKATCSLPEDDIDRIGEYVQVGDTADCCRCPASAGYEIKGECQPFCAFYQPCLTTNTSSFAPNPDYDPTFDYGYADPNVTRVRDEATKSWVCKCNAQYHSTSDKLNDCSIYTPLARDVALNETIPWYGPGTNPPSSLVDNGDGGDGGGGGTSASDVAKNPVFIGMMSALGGLLLMSGGVSFYQQSVAAKALAATEQTPLVPQPAPSSSVGGRAGRRSRSRSVSMKRGRSLLVYLVCALAVGCVQAAPFVWPQTQAWSTTTPRSVCFYDVANANYVLGPGNGNLYPTVIVQAYETFPGAPSASGPHIFTSSKSCDNDPILPPEWSPRLFDAYYLHAEPSISDPYAHRRLANPPGWTLPMNLPFTFVAPDFYDPGMKEPQMQTYTLGLSSTATVTIGDLAVPSSLVTYSNLVVRQVVWETYTAFQFINTCEPTTMGCGQHGTCVTAYADIMETDARWTRRCAAEGDHTKCTVHGKGSPAWGYGTPPGYSWLGGHQRVLSGVRGCKCDHGWSGVRCDQACPTGKVRRKVGVIGGTLTTDFDHDICSGNGMCSENVAITNQTDLRTCMCQSGCKCNQGYTGDRCEKAVQTAGAPAVVLSGGFVIPARDAVRNFLRCCPLDNPDCTPIQSRRDSSKVCRPTKPCLPGTTCECDTSDYIDSFHLPSDLVCGETQTQSITGWMGNAAGRGRCWHGSGSYRNGTTIDGDWGFCWCNIPPGVQAGGVANQNGRRGWWGENCQKRTCTTRADKVYYPDATGKRQLGSIVNKPASAPDTVQCSGHSHGSQNGASSNYDDDTQPCADKSIWGMMKTNPPREGWNFVNDEGRCIRCADGWGFFQGYRSKDLKRAGYLTKDTSYEEENGLCGERTFHSGGGVACGGYGVPNQKEVQLFQNTTAANPSSFLANYTSACTCPAEWGLATTSSGICQRSCAGSAAAAQIPFNMTDAFGNYIGPAGQNFTADPTPIRCGGFRQGLCRPIVYGERSDGWNSACMCNIGFNGPNCDRVPHMWVGETVCGADGEAVLQSPSNTTTRLAAYDDQDWFYRYIVPLNGPELLTAQVFSAYKCQCKAPKRALGWSVNEYGICVRGPSSFDLYDNQGQACSARGRIVPDMNADVAYNARGSVCQCDLGWGGANCGDRILHDLLGAPCGGSDRGEIVYADAFNLTQRCACRAPYIPRTVDRVVGSTTYGLCWADCPKNCTSPINGACSMNLQTGNDNICYCRSLAFGGLDCSKRLVAVFLTQSGTELPCTSHGVPDPDQTGACKCDADWTGYACEIYLGNRQCGAGQSFLDTESVGIVVRTA